MENVTKTITSVNYSHQGVTHTLIYAGSLDEAHSYLKSKGIRNTRGAFMQVGAEYHPQGVIQIA